MGFGPGSVVLILALEREVLGGLRLAATGAAVSDLAVLLTNVVGAVVTISDGASDATALAFGRSSAGRADGAIALPDE